MVNTYWPLTLPAWFGGGIFNIFLLRQFFCAIPRDYDEAALLDGAITSKSCGTFSSCFRFRR
ncbi:MAG: hypothetical protein R3E79_61410 [Caldilineaceae bacterium]